MSDRPLRNIVGRLVHTLLALAAYLPAETTAVLASLLGPWSGP